MRPKKLASWIRSVATETLLEPEIILFAAFLCGLQFRVTRPEAQALVDELRTWLTQHPRNMASDLADVFIEAIGPGLIEAAQRKGWQRGLTDEPYIRKKGAPLRNRGAWVAGLCADAYLRQAGAKREAVALAVGLVSVLLGRDVQPYEFYRFRKPLQQDDVKSLTQEITLEFEHWVFQDAVRAGHFYCIANGAQEYAPWRSRHRTLLEVLCDFSGDQLARIALRRIPTALWDPFWRPERLCRK